MRRTMETGNSRVFREFNDDQSDLRLVLDVKNVAVLLITKLPEFWNLRLDVCSCKMLASNGSILPAVERLR